MAALWDTGGMFKVELYGRVRRAVLVDGVSQRAAAREFGISRKSVRKMVSFSVPPGYRREQPAKRPKLDAWVGVIDAILEEDKTRPAKQRHTAKRVWDRLREEHQFTGGYTIVKDYLRCAAKRGQEMFVPLTHPAGEAQADFPPQQRRPVAGDPGLRRSCGCDRRRGVQGALSCDGSAALRRLLRDRVSGRDDGGVS